MTSEPEIQTTGIKNSETPSHSSEIHHKRPFAPPPNLIRLPKKRRKIDRQLPLPSLGELYQPSERTKLPTYCDILFPCFFPMRNACYTVCNRSIRSRILNSIREVPCPMHLLEDETAETCLLWIRSSQSISVAKKQIQCARLIYEYCNGDILDNNTKTIYRICDRPTCIRPSHLSIKDTLKGRRIRTQYCPDFETIDCLVNSVLRKILPDSNFQNAEFHNHHDSLRISDLKSTPQNIFEQPNAKGNPTYPTDDDRDTETILDEEIAVRHIDQRNDTYESADYFEYSDSDLSNICGSCLEEEISAEDTPQNATSPLLNTLYDAKDIQYQHQYLHQCDSKE
jgi:hypothetical protein